MIKIKQRGDKWLVDVEETFEFDKSEVAKKIVDNLFDLKSKHGQQTNFKKDDDKVVRNGKKRR